MLELTTCVRVGDSGRLIIQFANKQHASLRESVARLERMGQLGVVGKQGECAGERAILRQILGLEVAKELGVPKHPTDSKFLHQVQHVLHTQASFDNLHTL